MKKKMFFVFISSLLIYGCQAKIDKTSVQPKIGIPVSNQVLSESTPYDPTYPTYLVIVEPVAFAGRSIVRQGESAGKSGDNISNKEVELVGESRYAETWATETTTFSYSQRAFVISAQLTSALSAIGNITVIENRPASPSSSQAIEVNKKEGEIGPYVVKALITAYEPRVESQESDVGVLGTGSERLEVVGMVVLDVSITDVATGRVVSSIPVSGTFRQKSSDDKVGLITPIIRERRFVQSIMEQAMRMALNSAALKTFDALKKQPASRL